MCRRRALSVGRVRRRLRSRQFIAQQAGYYVLCLLPSGKELRMPKGDFAKVCQIWLGYLASRIWRVDIRDVTRHSKYILAGLIRKRIMRHEAAA
jgi:hypothetical protein